MPRPHPVAPVDRGRSRTLLAAVGLLALLLASPGAAAEVVALDLAAGPLPETMALAAIRAHGRALGSSQAELSLLARHAVPGGQVLRFRQVHQGLFVLGGGVAAIILDGRLVALSGNLHTVGKVEARPGSGLMDLGQVTASLQGTLPGVRVRRGYLALLPPARAVWVLDAADLATPGLWEVVVDARSGAVLSGRSTLVQANGKVAIPNPKTGQVVVKALQGLTSQTQLKGQYADVQRCGVVDQTTVTCDRLAKPDASGHYIYDPWESSLEDPFSEVQAYYHVDTFHRWLGSSFGFARKGSQQILVMVNFYLGYSSGQKSGYPNAFYGDIDGDGTGDLVFGQSTKDFAYDSDVIYHEFTHSAVHETSDLSATLDSLGLNAMPMALNEGFADTMACLYTGESVLGEYMTSGGIRTLTGSASCPKDLSGESHQDGLIWSRALWSIRTKVTSKTDFDNAVYTTMVGLTQTSSFSDAAKLLVQVAGKTSPSMATLADTEFKSRGYSSCTRIITLTESQPRTGFIYGTSSLKGLSVVPAALQYKIDVPQNATELQIELRSLYGLGQGMPGYVRRGNAVYYGISKSTYDHLKESSSSSLRLTTQGPSNLLVPGSSYYVLPMNTKDSYGMYQIRHTVKKSPVTPDAKPVLPLDAGPSVWPDGTGAPADAAASQVNPAGGLPGRGCSCTVSGEGTAAGDEGWVLLLLTAILAGLLRRGKRRRRGS